MKLQWRKRARQRAEIALVLTWQEVVVQDSAPPILKQSTQSTRIGQVFLLSPGSRAWPPAYRTRSAAVLNLECRGALAGSPEGLPLEGIHSMDSQRLAPRHNGGSNVPLNLSLGAPVRAKVAGWVC